MKEFLKRCPFVVALLFSTVIIGGFWLYFNGNDIAEKLNAELIIVNNNARNEMGDNLINNDAPETDLPADQLAEDAPEKARDADEMTPDESADESEAKTDKAEVSESQNGNTYEENEEVGSQTEDEDNLKIGETEFIYYTPVKIDSPYYEDPGRKPLTTNYLYQTVDETYFDDAAFIGDSRAVGLFDYAGFDGADFYCDNGFCTYLWKKNGTVTYQKNHAKVNLEEALQEKQYGKIYIMLGMNDCGYGNSQTFKEDFSSLVECIENLQPNAIIYLMANMYITKEKCEQDKVFNNIHINDKNVRIAECADGINRFYLDYNDLYLDEEGNLKKELSFDGVHLYGSQYGPWIDFIKEHAVVK